MDRVAWVLACVLTIDDSFSVLQLGLTTPTDLAQALVGPEASVSNVVLLGTPGAAGSFTGGGAVLGINHGIVLSSGGITYLPGPNSIDGASHENCYGSCSDADLSDLVGLSIYDRCGLEFDFVDPRIGAGETARLEFAYVFGSEEYNEEVGTDFNDVFGLFVDGTNVAVLPDSSPVCVNNVNCGNPYSPPDGAQCEIFINNDLQDGGGTIDVEMDGLTTVLTASAMLVGPGPHHLKLAIGDATDNKYDSQVFLAASELSVLPPSCIPPTPALELGSAPLAVSAGTPVAYPIVAIAIANVGTPSVTIVHKAFRAPLLEGGSCGNFVPAFFPAGAVHVPSLPVWGQPAVADFAWTPSPAQAGCWRLLYDLYDHLGQTSTFTVEVRVTNPFQDLGGGCPGAAGVPVLVGQGPLLPATSVTLSLLGGAPAAATTLVIGTDTLGITYKGCPFDLAPLVTVADATDVDGSVAWSGLWPPAVLPGFALCFKAYVMDPAGPMGLSASNVLCATTP